MTPFQIRLDNRSFPADPDLTLVKNAAKAGIEIPTLCQDNSFLHRAGCMVCAVLDLSTGHFIPACTRRPTENGCYEQDSETVRTFRRNALSLLLSEHHGDCISPCVRACPVAFPIPQTLGEIARQIPLLHPFPPCENCDRRCEKACRRKQLDSAVDIADILLNARPTVQSSYEKPRSASSAYRHTERPFSKENLCRSADSATDPNSCLQCHCLAEHDCKLRTLATRYDAKVFPSASPFIFERYRGSGIVYEPGKCIRCGTCTAITEQLGGNGLSMTGRGKTCRPFAPYTLNWEQVFAEHGVLLAEKCPTGALKKEFI